MERSFALEKYESLNTRFIMRAETHLTGLRNWIYSKCWCVDCQRWSDVKTMRRQFHNHVVSVGSRQEELRIHLINKLEVERERTREIREHAITFHANLRVARDRLITVSLWQALTGPFEAIWQFQFSPHKINIKSNDWRCNDCLWSSDREVGAEEKASRDFESIYETAWYAFLCVLNDINNTVDAFDYQDRTTLK